MWTESDRCCFVWHENSDYRPHGCLTWHEAESKQGVFSLIEALSQKKYVMFESGGKHFANIFLVQFECLQRATILVGIFGRSWHPWCSGWGGLVAQLNMLLVLGCTRMSLCLCKLLVAPDELWKGGFAVNPIFFPPSCCFICVVFGNETRFGGTALPVVEEPALFLKS